MLAGNDRCRSLAGSGSTKAAGLHKIGPPLFQTPCPLLAQSGHLVQGGTLLNPGCYSRNQGIVR